MLSDYPENQRVELLPHFPPAAQKILDVGCGPAVIAARIAADRPRATVIGVDRSDARLPAAADLIDWDPRPAQVLDRRAQAALADFEPLVANAYRVERLVGIVALADLATKAPDSLAEDALEGVSKP